MPTSSNLNFEREAHGLESPDKIFCRGNSFTNPKNKLNNMRLKNRNRLICAHLNINPVRNKFELLSDIVRNDIYILMISETKLYLSFPNRQFQIYGYSEPYRFDGNGNGGGILAFICKDIRTKLIESEMKIEGLFIELNLRRKKWLLRN